jgi:hypothetical protein
MTFFVAGKIFRRNAETSSPQACREPCPHQAERKFGTPPTSSCCKGDDGLSLRAKDDVANLNC